MKRINFENITSEQLKKIYSTNSVIREKVEEDYQENTMFWIGEQLDYIEESLLNYNIGFYGNNFIRVKSDYEFLKGLWEMEKAIPALTEEQNEELEELINKLDELEDEELESESEKFQEYLLKAWQKELNCDYTEYLENYFIDNFDRIINDSMLIDENNIVYELKSFE